ncbi:Lrp/AsnC family transcriptional regulator [Thermococcus thioreducens]|uniref:AsnC family transcriptional regulator n=1 Tax=Thermococcus thioreducens TaxID=277988 RepID=A0A0Q2M2P7_9EURY|nr:Lrp/AsnC family transcriptional regulator [Thermococcus thioreducens]ASJ12838.1 AsnC family transcriptional regulator [Thermococcus thioreducens]KQH82305.1 AsnC family transcriptional regulator [Thermococcus thioreducens]SEV84521.1 transcriptional regulator, AsnC family [Thermococcus thioreducens]
MPGIDEKDREILRILRKEGRITLTELGKRVGLSPASVKNRVEKLEKLGAIKGYSAIVDPAFLDEYVQAFFELKLAIDDHTVDPILRRIARLEEVQSLYRRSGERQILVRASFHDTDEVKAFAGRLKRLFGKNLERVEVTLIIDIFKENWVPSESKRR